MTRSWKITVHAPRETVQAALVAHEDAWEWDPEIVLSGCEVAEDRPDDWLLEAYLPRKPKAADKRAIAGLFAGEPPALSVEPVPERDWLTLSQQGITPIRAGRFYVRTPEFPALQDPGVIDFVIPAGQAFGTGQHETTAGCLAMLTHMKAQGVTVRNLADIGTGTGLLAFAALRLWPAALATASDIDPVCVGVVADNAGSNGIALGAGAGLVTMVAASGMDHALLTARGPYDLVIANILAGPLVDLAADFASSTHPGGNVLLAGLLTTQERKIRRAYRAAGFRLAARLVNGDWSVLWLRHRRFTKV